MFKVLIRGGSFIKLNEIMACKKGALNTRFPVTLVVYIVLT